MTTFREFWARSAYFGLNGGWDESRRAGVFFCLVNHAIFQQLRNARFSPNLVTKRSSVSRRWIRRDIFENFHLMDNLPPNLKSKLSQTGHGMHCREIMFTPRCSTRAVEFQRSVNFFCTTYGFGATGRQSCPIVGLFSPYKTPETYLPVTSLQPRGYVAECLRFFHVVVEDPKGYRPAAMFSCDFW